MAINKFRLSRLFLERAEIILSTTIIFFAILYFPRTFNYKLFPYINLWLIPLPILFISSFFIEKIRNNLKSILELLYGIFLVLSLIVSYINQFSTPTFLTFLISVIYVSTASRNDKIFLLINIPLIFLIIVEYLFINAELLHSKLFVVATYLVAFLNGYFVTYIRNVVVKKIVEREDLLFELFNNSKSALILYNKDQSTIKHINSKALSLLNVKKYDKIPLDKIEYKGIKLFKSNDNLNEFSFETEDHEILKIEYKKLDYKNACYYLITINLYDNLFDLSQTEEFKKLKEVSKEAYYKLFEKNDSLIAILSKDLEILDTNNTFNESFQIKNKKQLSGKNINSLINNSLNYLTTDLIHEAIDNVEPLEIEFTDEEKQELHLELLFSKGKFYGQNVFILNGRNISQRIKLQNELKVFYERYKYVTTESSIGFLAADLEGNIIEANQSFCDYLGYTKEEMLYMHIKDIAPKEETEKTLEIRERLIKGDIKSCEVIKKYLKKDGSIVHAIFTLLLQRDLNNKPQFFFAQVVDISEIRKAQKELEVSEKSYRDLFNNSEELLYVLDKKHCFIDVNEAVLKKYQFDKEEILGKTPEIFSAPDMNDLNEIINGMKEVWNGKNFSTLWWSIKKDGSVFPKKLKIKKGVYRNDEVLIATGIDISESYQYEKKLEEKEKLYRDLFERNLAGVYRTNLDGKILECNPTFLEILGINALDYNNFNLNITDFYKDINNRKEVIKKLKISQQLKDEKIKLVKENGKEITVLLNTMAVKNSDGDLEYFQGNLIDITQLEKVELELKQSQKNYIQLINSATFGIVILREEKIIFSNNKASEILGFDKPEELLGKESYDILLEEDKDHLDQQLKDIKQKNNLPFANYVIKKKGGFLIDVECKPSLIKYEGKNSILFTFIDISDKQKIKEVKEKIKSTEKFNYLLQTQLKEKEVLLQEVHHRVKNNMQIISSILNLQSHYIEDQKILDIIKDSQNRILTMSQIHEMLYSTKDFSGISFDKYIKDLARNILMSYNQVGKIAKLEFHLDEVELSIDQAIPSGLIVNELISNSVKYAFHENENPIISLYLQIEGDLIKIKVSDNGIGLPEEFNLNKLNSLGLQLVETLVDQLGGSLEINSSYGVSFTITFKRLHNV